MPSLPFSALSALRAFLSPKRSAGSSLSHSSEVYTRAHPLIFFKMNKLVYIFKLEPSRRDKHLRGKHDMSPVMSPCAERFSDSPRRQRTALRYLYRR